MRTKYIPMDQLLLTPSGYFSAFCLVVAFSMIFCYVWAHYWLKPICGSVKGLKQSPELSFGFRRIAPCGTQYQW